jgi:hypothetical protein
MIIATRTRDLPIVSSFVSTPTVASLGLRP